MDKNELFQKIREIEIKTRRLSKQVFSGEYHSAFKGRGMTFSEVKDYAFGDDVRHIDWNVTARFNSPFVKVFEEEREMSVFLILDLSESNNFGFSGKTKKDLLVEIAAVLAISAIQNNDKVGAIFLTDTIEKYIAPKKGRTHALMILRELLMFETENKGTNLNEGLKFFRNIAKRRSICFVISDFFDESNFIDGLKITNSRHDMVALRLHDSAEKELPDLGVIKMYDSESQAKHWVRTNSKRIKIKYRELYEELEQQLDEQLKRSGIDYAKLSTNEDYIVELNKLFLMRR